MNADALAVNQERKAGYEYWGDNLEAHRSHRRLAIRQVSSLAALIRAQVVMPIPHLKLTLQRQDALWAAVRNLLRDEEYLQLLATPVHRPPITKDDGPAVHVQTRPRTAEDARIQNFGDPAYYLARTLAMASASYSRYLPPSATEWGIPEQRLRRLGTGLPKAHLPELTLAPALLQSELPYFSNLASADVLAARQDEEGFEYWRTGFTYGSTADQEHLLGGRSFIEEARDVLRDRLDEPAAAARRAASRTDALKRNLRPNALVIATGAAGALADPAHYGAVAAGAAVTGALRWLIDGLFPPKALLGRNVMLAHLGHRGSPHSIEADWPKRGRPSRGAKEVSGVSFWHGRGSPADRSPEKPADPV